MAQYQIYISSKSNRGTCKHRGMNTIMILFTFSTYERKQLHKTPHTDKILFI